MDFKYTSKRVSFYAHDFRVDLNFDPEYSGRKITLGTPRQALYFFTVDDFKDFFGFLYFNVPSKSWKACITISEGEEFKTDVISKSVLENKIIRIYRNGDYRWDLDPHTYKQLTDVLYDAKTYMEQNNLK